MISKKMTNALNEQINAELKSAYLYLAMSLEADSIALKGVANWFFIQWQEEQDHARILQKYVLEQNSKVVLKTITDTPAKWKSPLEMFMDALAHEKEVTRLIRELVKLAFEEGDLATLSRLQWFVDEQVEEEASAMQQVDAFRRIEGHPELTGQLDDKLNERQYTPAEPLKR